MRKKQSQNQKQISNIQAAQKLIMKIHEHQSQTKSYNLMQTLISGSKIVYADQNKQYVIVKTKYYNELEQGAKQSKQKLQELEQTVDDLLTTIIKSQQIMKEKNERINELIIKSNISRQISDKIGGSCVSWQQNIRKQIKQAQILQQKLMQSVQNHKKYAQQLRIPTIQSKQSKNVKQQEIQTQLQIDAPTISLINSKKSIHQQSSNQIIYQNSQDRQITKLKSKFKQIIQTMETQLQIKVQEIKKTLITVYQLQQNNQILLKQNKQLKDKLYEINQQQKKLQAWKNSVKEFLDKTQNQVEHQANDDISEEMSMSDCSSFNSYAARQKIRVLEERVDKLLKEKAIAQNKSKQIIRIMSVNQSEIGDEGIIQNLVKLSSKVKEYIEHMLKQI